jgi:creatinine amidohydrolase
MRDALSPATDLDRERPSLAVLPIGSIEQHSRHLPVGTDWIAATALAHEVARELDAFVLPALPASMGRCHKPMAGTVWLRPMTLADAVSDVVRSLAASGFRQVLLVNGHGGNFTLEVATRELNLAHADLTVMLPPMSVRARGPAIFETAGLEVHAGESETSVMLAIDASLVGDDRVDLIPPVGREFLDYAFVGDLSPDGVWGKPSLATRDKGERAFAGRVAGVVAYARETLETVATLRGVTADRPAARRSASRSMGGAAATLTSGTTWLDWGPWAIGDGLNARSTTVEIARGRPRIGILPVAAIEAHGPHLPVGTDLVIVESIARRVARHLGADAYLLPTLPFGNSTHLRGVAGTADLSPDTLRRVIQDVAVALHETGIHHVAVIGGHGLVSGNTVVPFGNFIVKAAVRQLNHEHPEMDAIWVQPLAAAGKALAKVFAAGADDVHAGEVETSLMMALSPQSVGEPPADHVPTVSRDYLDLVPFSRIAPGGVWGRPRLASRDKGDAAVVSAAEATAAYVTETFETLGRMKKTRR